MTHVRHIQDSSPSDQGPRPVSLPQTGGNGAGKRVDDGAKPTAESFSNVSLEVGQSRSLEYQVLGDKLLRPSFLAIYNLTRQTPRLRSLRAKFHNSREDLLDPQLDADQSVSLKDHPYRRVQSILISLSLAARDRTLRPLLEHAIDYEAQRDSLRLKEQLFSGTKHYLPVVTTGAGGHGAIFNTRYLTENPGSPAITFEKSNILGGQFRSYGAPVIRMNTENGPIRQDLSGSNDIDDFNSLGEKAILQLNQLCGDLFPTNMDIGLAMALNQYLRSYTALGVETVDSGGEDPTKRAFVTIRDVETQQIATHDIGVGVLVPGLGRDRRGFRNADAETSAALKENDSLEPRNRFYHTYGDVLSLFGSHRGTLARELFSGKDVIIQGGGHSALTVIERITGLFNDPEDYSVAAIQGPRSIVVIGSKYETAQDFLAHEMGRYGAASRLFPADATDTGSLVSPICNSYAFQMRKDGDRIQVLYGPKTFNPKTDSIESLSALEGDVLIATTGFDPAAEKILGFSRENNPRGMCIRLEQGDKEIAEAIPFVRCDATEMHHQALTALHVPGCRFRCEDGHLFVVEVRDGDYYLCTCTESGIPDPSTEAKLLASEIETYLKGPNAPVEILYPDWDGRVKSLPPVICDESGDIVGRYGLRPDLIIAGPASAPVVAKAQFVRGEQFGSPTNPVSLSSSRRGTEQLGQLVANLPIDHETAFEFIGEGGFVRPDKVSRGVLPDSLNPEPLLHYALLRGAHEWRGENVSLEGIQVTLERGEHGELKVSTNVPLESPAQQEYLANVLNDPLLQRIAENLVSTDFENGYDMITFPLSKADIQRAMRRLSV